MQRRRARLVVSLGGVALFLVAGCGTSDTGGALDSGGGTIPLRPGATTVPDGATALVADLSGAEEVGGPGAPKGTGTVRLVATPDGKVCVDITTDNIEPPQGAHVHRGAKGQTGPHLVDLPTPTIGTSSGCVMGDPASVAELVANPAGAYINIHTAALPDGAIRGQLTKA